MSARGDKRLKIAGGMLPWSKEEILAKLNSLTEEQRLELKPLVDWVEEYQNNE